MAILECQYPVTMKGRARCGYAAESIVHTKYDPGDVPTQDSHPFVAPVSIPWSHPHRNLGPEGHGHDAWTCKCGWWGNHGWMGYAIHLEDVMAGRLPE